MICDRCGAESLFATCSYFNTETICRACSTLEQAHPLYERARRIEAEYVRAGHFNFPGVGLPADLRRKGKT